jgi:hypothetical protein
MFAKLHFTQDKNLFHVFRILADLIKFTNTGLPSGRITDVASFYNKANTGGWPAVMISGFDPANSAIYAVDQFDSFNAHMYGNPVTTQGKFTLEMPIADSPGQKVFIQYTNNSTTYTSFYLTVGTIITGTGVNTTYNTLAFAPQLANNATTNALGGSNLSVGGYVSTYNDVGFYVAGTSAASSVSSTAIRTLWVHATPRSFSWATNQSATTNGSGWPAQWNSVNNYAGPWVFTQSTRLDYWNTGAYSASGAGDGNLMYPFIYTVPKTDGQGFSANDYITGAAVNSDFTTSNPAYATRFAAIMLPKINWVPNTPAGTPVGFYRNSATGYAAPALATGVPVNLFIKTQNTNSQTSLEAVGNYPNANNYVGYSGWAISNLNINTSGLSPNVITSTTSSVESYTQNGWGWNKHSYGVMGGNVSDYTNTFIFNGIYTGNDEYTLTGTDYVSTYSIWPPFEGPNTRIGFAFSKR